MGEKKVVNLSRFLMFEEAGDSEADFVGNMALDYDQANAEEAHDDDDDYDAESCSSDVGCYGSLQSTRDAILFEISEEKVLHNNETHSDEDDVDYDERSCHHQMRAFQEDEDEEEEIMSDVTSTANSYDNSRKCVQSSNKAMSEMEKSRLFWEACLAS